MKKNRLILLGLFILSLVAISFYGGPVSYGFFFFILFTPAVSALYTLFVYFRFRIYQKIETKVAVVDTPVAFYYSLKNEDRFGFAGVRTGFYTDFSTLSGIDPDTEYELFPGTGIERESRLICKYRGEYEVGIKSVEIQDYFRLIRISYHNKETLRVIVKPNLVDLSELKSIDLSQTMARETPFSQMDPDVLVRNYEPGDDVRQMNWKASARQRTSTAPSVTAPMAPIPFRGLCALPA